ncbi:MULTISPECIES: flagellar protein FlaG [Vibrio]|uniref:Flagellar protein FlaG n=2 Tax=Vibrio TaxID=662 RepID=A0A7X4LHI7_9VIBR|nr:MULTISPECIES: flagellar protein FlaG [Vibrio]MBF8999481.1 flagellar protein FlaG [Vibrio nitrifigilis]MZI92053.1 flagellar protein FlaG [Vibrio eleionomae]
MEVPSYASNIQPYGSQNGIKLASENDSVKRVSNSKDEQPSVGGAGSMPDPATEQMRERRRRAVDATNEMVRKREQLNEEQRAKMMEQMHDFVNSINKGLSFRMDKESGREVVTIYEASTGDVIRQIPEEEMLEVLRRLAKEQDHKSGLVNAKV